MRVEQHVVHRLETGSPRGPEPGHLDRRRLQGKNTQPVVAHVVAGIDQDIDAVCTHHGRHLVVGTLADVSPVVEYFFESGAELVFDLDVRIGKNLHRSMVVVGKKGQEIKARCVAPEVRRNVSHFEPTSWCAVMAGEIACRHLETVAPAHKFRKDVGRAEIWVVRQRIQALLPQHRIIRQ